MQIRTSLPVLTNLLPTAWTSGAAIRRRCTKGYPRAGPHRLQVVSALVVALPKFQTRNRGGQSWASLSIARAPSEAGANGSRQGKPTHDRLLSPPLDWAIRVQNCLGVLPDRRMSGAKLSGVTKFMNSNHLSRTTERPDKWLNAPLACDPRTGSAHLGNSFPSRGHPKNFIEIDSTAARVGSESQRVRRCGYDACSQPIFAHLRVRTSVLRMQGQNVLVCAKTLPILCLRPSRC